MVKIRFRPNRKLGVNNFKHSDADAMQYQTYASGFNNHVMHTR